MVRARCGPQTPCRSTPCPNGDLRVTVRGRSRGRWNHDAVATHGRVGGMRHHRVHSPEEEQRAATIFMLLFFLMILAQMLLVYWKKKRYKSYQQVTLFGLWLIPFLFAEALHFYKLITCWSLWTAGDLPCAPCVSLQAARARKCVPGFPQRPRARGASNSNPSCAP